MSPKMRKETMRPLAPLGIELKQEYHTPTVHALTRLLSLQKMSLVGSLQETIKNASNQQFEFSVVFRS